MSRIATALIALALLAGCPEPEECNASRPCATGFQCVAARCETVDAGGGGGPVDAGPDKCRDPSGSPLNLLDNPSFECGDPPIGWYSPFDTVAVETTNPKDGARAIRFESKKAVVAAGLHHDSALVPNSSTYCVSAWVRGGDAGNVRLGVKRVGPNMEDNYSAPLTPNWTLLPPQGFGPMKVDGTGATQLQLRLFVPGAEMGHSMFVDRVQMWESTSGKCDERVR